MAKYKLRLAEPGDYLYCEGEAVYVGDTVAEALEFYIEEGFEDGPDVWVHPEILRGRVVYARDVEDGNCHEEAEPGDTTYDGLGQGPGTATRELGPNEIRTWPRGTWRPHWMIKPPWCSSGKGHEVIIEGRSIGREYPSLQAAYDARDQAEDELVEAWKEAHPEFHRTIPEEDDDA